MTTVTVKARSTTKQMMSACQQAETRARWLRRDLSNRGNSIRGFLLGNSLGLERGPTNRRPHVVNRPRQRHSLQHASTLHHRTRQRQALRLRSQETLCSSARLLGLAPPLAFNSSEKGGRRERCAQGGVAQIDWHAVLRCACGWVGLLPPYIDVGGFARLSNNDERDTIPRLDGYHERRL